jgi:hypothetical protein
MPSDPDDEVGYKKPPKHARFRKGQSGNPRGRSRGAKNLMTQLTEALDKKITVVTENGRRRQITKLEAALTQLANRAAQGDLKATQILLTFKQEIERSTSASAEPGSFTENDEQALQFIRDHLLGGHKGESDGEP